MKKRPTPEGKPSALDQRRESITPGTARLRLVNTALDLLVLACVAALVVLVVEGVK